jgi:hypothetical protein
MFRVNKNSRRSPATKREPCYAIQLKDGYDKEQLLPKFLLCKNERIKMHQFMSYIRERLRKSMPIPSAPASASASSSSASVKYDPKFNLELVSLMAREKPLPKPKAENKAEAKAKDDYDEVSSDTLLLHLDFVVRGNSSQWAKLDPKRFTLDIDIAERTDGDEDACIERILEGAIAINDLLGGNGVFFDGVAARVPVDDRSIHCGSDTPKADETDEQIIREIRNTIEHVKANPTDAVKYWQRDDFLYLGEDDAGIAIADDDEDDESDSNESEDEAPNRHTTFSKNVNIPVLLSPDAPNAVPLARKDDGFVDISDDHKTIEAAHDTRINTAEQRDIVQSVCTNARVLMHAAFPDADKKESDAAANESVTRSCHYTPPPVRQGSIALLKLLCVCVDDNIVMIRVYLRLKDADVYTEHTHKSFEVAIDTARVNTDIAYATGRATTIVNAMRAIDLAVNKGGSIFQDHEADNYDYDTKVKAAAEAKAKDEQTPKAKELKAKKRSAPDSDDDADEEDVAVAPAAPTGVKRSKSIGIAKK